MAADRWCPVNVSDIYSSSFNPILFALADYVHGQKVVSRRITPGALITLYKLIIYIWREKQGLTGNVYELNIWIEFNRQPNRLRYLKILILNIFKNI